MITNAKLVGENVDPKTYHAQLNKRGHPKFVMSSSQIKAFKDSPEGWIAGVEEDDTKSTDWGSVIDCMALTPDRWDQQFAVTPKTYPDKKTGEQKPWTFKADFCKEWREDHASKQIVTADELVEAMEAKQVLRKNQIIANLIDGSSKQVYIEAEWHDQEVGLQIPLKALIDLVPGTLLDCLVDLKTIFSVQPRAFVKSVNEYGYHLSAAFYLDMFNAATGEERNDFRFILQLNKAPWTTGLRFITPDWIDFGRRQYEGALKEYAWALEHDKWPSHEERAAERGAVVIDGFLEAAPESYMLGGW